MGFKLNILAAIALSLLLAGCGADSVRPARMAVPLSSPVDLTSRTTDTGPLGAIDPRDFEEGPIRIAILLPLTGPSTATGQALLDAASLAFFQAYDPRIQLLPFDTLGTGPGAERAARAAVDAEAVMVLGPLFSDATEAAAQITRSARIPMVALTNNAALAGDGVYLLSFSPGQEVRRIVHYAASQGRTRFAGLIPDDAYGDIVLRSLSSAVNEVGGDLTALEVYARNADEVFDPVRRLADYDARRRAWLDETQFLESLGGDLAEEILAPLKPLEAIGDVPFDAVLVPEGGEMLRSLVPLLPFYEVDPAKVQFMGTGLWDDRSLVHEPPLRGGIYASASPEITDAFVEQFRAVYGYAPPRIATLAYDGMALATYLAREQVKRRRFTRAAFEVPTGFQGVDGPFRFTADGLAERELAIIQIGAQDIRTIQAAPAGFPRGYEY